MHELWRSYFNEVLYATLGMDEFSLGLPCANWKVYEIGLDTGDS